MMAKAAASPILQLIRRVVEDPQVRELPDRDLLQRFHAQQDQAAFHSLLRRHGPMVLDICRGVLGDGPDADDAFQATFLVLAQKAGSIRKGASLGSWLHGVARRTALKARAQSAVRHKHLDSEENYVAVAFERFWQGTIDQQIEFSTLATALHYLHVSLNGAILERLRASRRPKEVPLPQPGSPKELPMEDAPSGAEVWERLQRMFLTVREQRLAYLLFHCGLQPGEIVHCCSREFSDLYEIYRLRHNIMERLLCNLNHLRL